MIAASTFFAAMIGSAVAFPTYIPLNPNSLSIPWTIAIGHISTVGGGTLSPYGLAFQANNYNYSLALACLDSDNDGFPNGWELGDPCGNWTQAVNKPTWTNDISHPGNDTSVPLTRKVNYAICGAKNPCAAAEVQAEMALLQARTDALTAKVHAQAQVGTSLKAKLALRGGSSGKKAPAADTGAVADADAAAGRA